MRQIGQTETKAGKRFYYINDDGVLVSRLVEEADMIEPVIQANREAADNYRAHRDGGLRQIAEIPVSLYVKWLNDEGIPGYCDSAALDHVVNKKLRDPDNKYLLTVPENYRMMKHG